MTALTLAAPGTEAVHTWDDDLVLNDRVTTGDSTTLEADYRYWVDRVSMGTSAAVTAPSSPRVGGIGTTPLPGVRGSRVVTYEGRIQAVDTSSLRVAETRLKAAFFPVDRPRVMRIAHHPDYRLEEYTFTGRSAEPVVADAFNESRLPTAYEATFTVGIELNDPRVYLDEPTVLTMRTAARGGVQIPLVVPMVLPPAPLPELTVSATVRTVVPTPIVVRFTGPVSRPTLVDLTNDRTLALDLTIAEDQWVDVDLGAGTVTDPDGNTYPGAVAWPESTWWTPARGDLDAGPIQIRYDGDYLGTGAKAEVTYRPAVP